MRTLEPSEYCLVSGTGTDTLNVYTPGGAVVTTQLEQNQSTTIKITLGELEYTWNSGEFITCSTLGAGVGLTLGAFTANPVIGRAAAFFSALGCKTAFSKNDEDGDEF